MKKGHVQLDSDTRHVINQLLRDMQRSSGDTEIMELIEDHSRFLNAGQINEIVGKILRENLFLAAVRMGEVMRNQIPKPQQKELIAIIKASGVSVSGGLVDRFKGRRRDTNAPALAALNARKSTNTNPQP